MITNWKGESTNYVIPTNSRPFSNNDPNLKYFSSVLPHLVKKGGVATWWNSMGKASNAYRINNVEYQEFEVNPPKNSYFNYKTYYLPKWQH